MTEQPNNSLIQELVDAAQSVQSQLTHSMLEELQAAEAAWQKLPEEKQQAVIDRLRRKSESIVRGIVSVVAARGFEHGQAVVDQVVFKDGVKVVLKSTDRKSAHKLADREGASVTIVFAEPSEYLSTEGYPEPDPDQGYLRLPDGD